MSAYQSNIIYHTCLGVVQLLNLTFVFLALGQARTVGERNYPKWLVPFAVGDILQFLLWAASTFRYFIWPKPGIELAYGLAFGTLIPAVIVVYGSYMIWNTLRIRVPANPEIEGD